MTRGRRLDFNRLSRLNRERGRPSARRSYLLLCFGLSISVLGSRGVSYLSAPTTRPIVVNQLKIHADDTLVFGLMERLLAAADRCDIECLVFLVPTGTQWNYRCLFKVINFL